MEVIEVSESFADELCGKEESHFFDRKGLGIKPNKIQKLAVAFANSDGGEFVVGIADDKEEPDIKSRWKGAINIEFFNEILHSLIDITPSLNFVAKFLKCQNKSGYVLHVDIDKSSLVHKTSDNTVYVRVSAQSVPYKDPNKILELAYAKGSSTYEDEVVTGSLPEDIVESKEIKSFLDGNSFQIEPLDFALNQNLINRKNFEPKAAGILLFCDNPSAVMPKKCAVKIARYETREDEPERDHLKSIDTIELPLYKLIHETVKRVSEIMSSVHLWTIEGLKCLDYPPEAIWEIIVNAVIHRDYSISDDILIQVYDNRIEVLSPGKLPGFVTVENIRASRYSRNPKIVRLLNRYKNPPNKDIGEGLNTVYQKMKEWKLKEPEILEVDNYVKVIIPHVPLATPDQAILEFLQKNGVIRNRQARDITGIRSENSIKRVFYNLRDQGLIDRVPGLEGSSAAWQLVSDNDRQDTDKHGFEQLRLL